MKRIALLPVLLAAPVFLVGLLAADAEAFPAFARKHNLKCSACHEAWPKLNDFGLEYRDNGYQMGTGKDEPILYPPEFWPVSLRVKTGFEDVEKSRQSTDRGRRTVETRNFKVPDVILLGGGTLARDLSFFVDVEFEKVKEVKEEFASVRFSNILASPLLNLKFGLIELDTVTPKPRRLTDKRHDLFLNFSPNGRIDKAVAFGTEQLGLELMGHTDSGQRYALYAINGTDSRAEDNKLPDFYGRASQAFETPIGRQKLGVFGYFGNTPTRFLTSGGTPIGGTGRENRQFFRVGPDLDLRFGPFNLLAAYMHGEDDKDLIKKGTRDAVLDGALVELNYIPFINFALVGRWEIINNSQQGDPTIPKGKGDTERFTGAVRYYPVESSRSGTVLKAEFSSGRTRKTASNLTDQVENTVFVGVEFAF